MNRNHGHDRVVYYYDSEVGNFHYGSGHPMKPFRIRLTHDLVVSYSLYRSMSIYRPRLITAQQMVKFHSQEYIDFLASITPDNYLHPKYKFNLEQFTLGPKSDCPIFDGMFEFCQRSVGGSIDGALRLCYNYSDTAINWSGGFHHAKKSESSGFCYVNDIVLAIIELLKHYQRVLYIDIDVHHGDGVEEAFYHTNRVLSFSLHKYGDGFFPGTGFYKDIGISSGKYHSVNFPFNDGIDDDGYFRVYTKIIDTIFERYQPNVVVLQCGADSLAQDRIGVFNISSRGHGRIVEYMKNKYNHNGSNNVPMLVIGGGGYNIKNVARLWCYETAILCNEDSNISDTIPYSDFLTYYKPNFKLHVDSVSSMLNKNTSKYLEEMTNKVLQQIQSIEIAPSVQINTPRIPHITQSVDEDNNEDDDIKLMEVESELTEKHPDKKATEITAFKEQYVAASNEIYDGDKDQDMTETQTNMEYKALLEKLRALTTDCVSKHHLSTARFYADKACIISEHHHSDVYTLANIHFLNKEYHRCILILQKHALIPYSNLMGIHDISFQNEVILTSNDENRNLSNNNEEKCIECTKHERFKYLVLGMQSFLDCGEYESCISMLSDSDDIALQFVEPDLIENVKNERNVMNLSSLLCMLRGKALEKLCIDQRALWWFQKALIFDSKNIEAFDCIIKRRLNTVQKIRAFVDNELHFDADDEWIKFYYQCKMNEIATEFESMHKMNESLISNSDNCAILSKSDDMKIIQSNCLLNLNLFRESYGISLSISRNDNYNISSLISHIVCLVELGKQSELYKTSHDLICAYPEHAVSWFSVGCYYYMTRRYEISRRFLHKATSLDKYFFAAWIVFGATFSEQDADDQAMASYRTVNRYFPNSYQPLLFMGMGYLNMNNYIYAEKFLKEAYKLFDADPMIYNELGVVYYHQKKYNKAKDFFQATIKYISSDCYNSWESTFFNLGHCYRKLKQYTEALRCYNKAFNISPRDPMILSAIAFTHHLQNKLDKAIDYYHKVLSLQPHDTFANEMLHRALQSATNQ